MKNIPNELNFLEQVIKISTKPFVEITLQHQAADIGLTESKLGGRPFYTSIDKYPLDKNGQPMILLAQLNFSDVPKLEDFPEDGLLQFFVANNEYFGLDIGDDMGDDYKVKYIPKEEIDVTKGIIKQDHGLPPTPNDFFVYGVHKMSFKLDSAPVTITDFQTKKFNFPFDEYYELSEENANIYWNTLAKTTKHKIGGYGHYSQDDPRSSLYNNNTVQLLQIVSTNTGDEKNDITMGLSGRGTLHFLIKSEELRNKDFSSVIYHWDTY